MCILLLFDAAGSADAKRGGDGLHTQFDCFILTHPDPVEVLIGNYGIFKPQ